jgi:hypothetical protein
MIPWPWLNTYRKLRALGLCTYSRRGGYCTNLTKGATVCSEHRERMRKFTRISSKKKYYERKLNAQCVRCGSPEQDTSLCRTCYTVVLDRVRAKRSRRYRQKRNAYERSRREKRTSQGMCIRCNQELVTTIYCEFHRREQIANARKYCKGPPDTKKCRLCRKPGHRSTTCTSQLPIIPERTAEFAQARQEM